ncbi:hypothetical protein LY474_18415 [Myxococcus stipitatus]|uniref:hypothetical protein n=1 Tax=Myxococcus stipitatus TaxID=83455 RepID=UPI001F18A4DA|nr:hypothetical protein [Myxococcus stipitatus]MCE9669774.1 hypothetical protein [Myxococcus stipitatus]
MVRAHIRRVRATSDVGLFLLLLALALAAVTSTLAWGVSRSGEGSARRVWCLEASVTQSLAGLVIVRWDVEWVAPREAAPGADSVLEQLVGLTQGLFRPGLARSIAATLFGLLGFTGFDWVLSDASREGTSLGEARTLRVGLVP